LQQTILSKESAVIISVTQFKNHLS